MRLRQIAIRLPDAVYIAVRDVADANGCSFSEAAGKIISTGLCVQELRRQIENIAQSYEREAETYSHIPQSRRVPKQQLAELKARHWRILQHTIDTEIRRVAP